MSDPRFFPSNIPVWQGISDWAGKLEEKALQSSGEKVKFANLISPELENPLKDLRLKLHLMYECSLRCVGARFLLVLEFETGLDSASGEISQVTERLGLRE